MVKVELDAASALRAGEATVASVSRFHRRAYQHVFSAVKAERDGHAYSNRSGNAERETKMDGNLTETGGHLTATMDVPYAGVLNKHGWSKFETLMQRAFKLTEKDSESLA